LSLGTAGAGAGRRFGGRRIGAGAGAGGGVAREGQQWEAARARLAAGGDWEPEEADAVLERAFGWGAASQRYWRQTREEQPPCPETVGAVLEFLDSLEGMDSAAMQKVVEKFPEVVGLPVEILRNSVVQLEKSFFMKGKVITKTVIRRPDLLGMDFDCLGDCKGQCHKCWVRF